MGPFRGAAPYIPRKTDFARAPYKNRWREQCILILLPAILNLRSLSHQKGSVSLSLDVAGGFWFAFSWCLVILVRHIRQFYSWVLLARQGGNVCVLLQMPLEAWYPQGPEDINHAIYLSEFFNTFFTEITEKMHWISQITKVGHCCRLFKWINQNRWIN